MELEALVALTHIPQLGPVKINSLLKYFGSAAAVWDCSEKTIQDVPDFGQRLSIGWDRWRRQSSWQQDLDVARKREVTVVPYTSPYYPKRLLQLHDHPIVLYVKGDLTAIDEPSVAVVGTRDCSDYGESVAGLFGEDLADLGQVVVSGLARGIDAAAHEGALKRGKTVAVLGFGLEYLYPRECKGLAEKIVQQGALISEYPMATPPERQRFPQRNRIVSGMTTGTLLIEAPVESGSMDTMRKALKQKRKLYALSGPLDCESFQGNHLLIKEGKAKRVERARDIAAPENDLFTLKGITLTETKYDHSKKM